MHDDERRALRKKTLGPCRSLLPLALLIVGCSEGDDGSVGPVDRGAGEPTDQSAQAVVVAGSVLADEPRLVEAEYDDAACPTADNCSGNTAPELGEPVFEINGRVYPDLQDVRNGDLLMVLVPVEDAECNLACGHIGSSLTSKDSATVGGSRLPSNVPCSTSESGIYLAAGVNLATFGGDGVKSRPPEQYQGFFSIKDVCGAAAEPVTFEFEVRF